MTDGENQNGTVLNQGLTSDAETPIETNNHIVNLDNDSIFQARVLLEQNSSVYGAEVIVFGSDVNQPIDRILITNLTEFNKYKDTVNEIKNNYIPYTKQDKDNMSIILDYLSRTTPATAEETGEYNKALSNSSYFKEKGDLQSILENNVINTIGETALNSFHQNKEIIINATHLNGVEEGLFERKGHTHGDNYLGNGHLSILGNDSEYGHVKIRDNLTTTTNNSEALSAKQGNILKNDIDKINKKISSGWTYGSIKSVNKGSLSYYVNELLHLFVFDFQYLNSTILKKNTGIHELESPGTIDARYRPTHRVSMPVYQGDIVLMVNTDGSVNIHNLSKHDTWNIRGQLIWYYK